LTQQGVQALVALGFAGLEAQVYAFLLQESPVSGYRIAQAIRKPVANTYKAIAALEGKGAIIVDDGTSRLCRAVPIEELLARLNRTFCERREQAARALAKIQTVTGDDRVYQLQTRDQVMERARAMLHRCQQTSILDIFPEPLEELRTDIEALASRGVTIAVKAYAPVAIDGASVIVTLEHETVRLRWPGQWINLVVDSQEHLLAFLTADGHGVHQAVWSESTYLSWVYHSGIISEWLLADVRRRIEEGATSEAIREVINEFAAGPLPNPLGYEVLVRRFGHLGVADSDPPTKKRNKKREQQ
jgi:sugar-specific transcriptional regulator TrmB